LFKEADLPAPHPQTVSRYADMGLIPSVKTLTGQRQFRVGDIRALIAGMKSGLSVIPCAPELHQVAV